MVANVKKILVCLLPVLASSAVRAQEITCFKADFDAGIPAGCIVEDYAELPVGTGFRTYVGQQWFCGDVFGTNGKAAMSTCQTGRYPDRDRTRCEGRSPSGVCSSGKERRHRNQPLPEKHSLRGGSDGCDGTCLGGTSCDGTVGKCCLPGTGVLSCSCQSGQKNDSEENNFITNIYL